MGILLVQYMKDTSNAIKLRNYSLHLEAETSVPQSYEMGHFWWK